MVRGQPALQAVPSACVHSQAPTPHPRTDLRESGIPGAVAGTFGDLRGDAGNEAAQHGHMAESMRVDIVEPLEQWKLTLTPMHQAVLGAQSQHSALVSASE